jgi:hypothetical protein
MAINFVNLTVPVPCIQGYFGERLSTYTTQVSPKQIVNLLGHDPRDRNWKYLHPELRAIYQYLQRKTAKSRKEGIGGYIEERFGPDSIVLGAFPALSMALLNPARFEPSGASGVGTLQLDISPTNMRVLIDGLGRVTGALDLIECGEGDLLDTFQFPVTIYAPKDGQPALTWHEMGQLFHDFNFRVHPVSQAHAVALDNSDIYILTADLVAELPVIKNNGGIARRAASLSGKATELVVQTVLVRMVRGAAEGRQFQEANLKFPASPNLTFDSQADFVDSVGAFFSEFAEAMGEVRFRDRDSLHLSSPGWQALGVIHHDLAYKLHTPRAQWPAIIRAIAQIDWSRYNSDWISIGLGQPERSKITGELVTGPDGRPRVAIGGAGRSNIQMIINYVREKAGIAQKLGAPA